MQPHAKRKEMAQTYITALQKAQTELETRATLQIKSFR
jgi:hypothetical protein